MEIIKDAVSGGKVARESVGVFTRTEEDESEEKEDLGDDDST